MTRKQTRAVRVDESLWRAAMTRAEERGESLSQAIRAFLVRYTR